MDTTATSRQNAGNARRVHAQLRQTHAAQTIVDSGGQPETHLIHQAAGIGVVTDQFLLGIAVTDEERREKYPGRGTTRLLRIRSERDKS